MDGNGRWANHLGLPRVAGHRAGAETLTVYAFSSDNWKRPPDEVAALMHLLAWYLEQETARLRADGVRLSVIGRRDRLPATLLAAIARAEEETASCKRLWLRLAIDYSARESILRASENVSRERFEQLLAETPPVDLLIRTGGEQRLSDFLLWECAYAELIFTQRMWPDFDANDLRHSVHEFHRRERRFGEVVSQDRWLR